MTKSGFPCLLAAFLMWFASGSLAVPVVESVAGIINGGGTLTITGTGFGPKADAKPLFWIDFENSGLPTSLGRNTTYVNPFGNSPPDGDLVSDTTYLGNGAWRWDCAGNGSFSFSFSGDRLYVNLKRFYGFDMMDSATWGTGVNRGFNLKTQRLWAWNSELPKQNILLGYQASDGAADGNPRVTAEYTQLGGSCWPELAGFVHAKWIDEEIVYLTGDINVQNGIFDYYRDGEVQWTRRFRVRTTDEPDFYDFLALDQVSNGTSANHEYVHYDNIYVDDSYSRVVLGDSLAYGSCTVYEPQIPSTWTTTSIEVTLNQGIFQPGDTAYLFVVDSSNTASLVGKQVVIGQQMTGIRTRLWTSGRVDQWTTGDTRIFDVLGRRVFAVQYRPDGLSRGSIWFVGNPQAQRGRRRVVFLP